ncbi:MAG: hypothetical protein JWR34_3913 [Mycobacterium sp.]|nr:hypothetical protein [Mycobacterium sp.]
MTATEDFFVTANAGEWLEHENPLHDALPSGDGLVAIADRPSLFKEAGEADIVIGTDGDDVGHVEHHQAVADMLDSGHGFLVRKIDQPKTVWRATCEVCDGPLPTPDDAPDWLCQYYDETQPASLTCNCPWCLKYQEYLAGMFKPQGGRPRQRCGNKACDRKADAERKAGTRLKDRRKRLVAEAAEALAEFDAMPEPEPSTGFVPLSLEDVPEGIREAVRAKLAARVSEKPPY